MPRASGAQLAADRVRCRRCLSISQEPQLRESAAPTGVLPPSSPTLSFAVVFRGISITVAIAAGPSRKSRNGYCCGAESQKTHSPAHHIKIL